MAEPTVLVARDGAVVTCTLNRPERMNAVSLGLYQELTTALEEADRNADVRCVVLTGAGRAFCAGADLKAHAAGPPEGEERSRYVDAAQRANRLLQTMATPVVAAVNGAAVGAGLELALSADFMIVSSRARLRLPEVALATFIGGGVAYTLVERVGALKARELIYFGDFFSGEDAASYGMANRAVAPEEVLPMAHSWAQRLSGLAPLSVAAAKRIVGPAADRTREEAMAEERRALEEIFGSSDWREGMAAFRDKRPAVYRGK